MKKLLILLLIVSACSPSKRLARLEKNHPELFRVDTIFKVDTFKVEGVRLDTVFKNEITLDTVTIVKDNVIIKYFNDGKTVYLAGETKTVEKIVKYPVTAKAAVIREKVNIVPWWVYLVFGLCAIVILGLLFRK